MHESRGRKKWKFSPAKNFQPYNNMHSLCMISSCWKATIIICNMHVILTNISYKFNKNNNWTCDVIQSGKWFSNSNYYCLKLVLFFTQQALMVLYIHHAILVEVTFLYTHYVQLSWTRMVTPIEIECAWMYKIYHSVAVLLRSSCLATLKISFFILVHVACSMYTGLLCIVLCMHLSNNAIFCIAMLSVKPSHANSACFMLLRVNNALLTLVVADPITSTLLCGWQPLDSCIWFIVEYFGTDPGKYSVALSLHASVIMMSDWDSCCRIAASYRSADYYSVYIIAVPTPPIYC